MKQKQLRLHKDKTTYIIFGTEAKKQEIRNQLLVKPLFCEAFKLKEKESDKYLGEIFHTDGLGRLALETMVCLYWSLNQT